MAELVKDYGEYASVMFEKHEKFVCKKCTDDIQKPTQTFRTEKAVVHHLNMKHGEQIKIEKTETKQQPQKKKGLFGR